MIRIGQRHYSLMILFAITLHYLWGFGLLIDTSAMNATALLIFNQLFGWGAAPLFVTLWGAATLSLISLVEPLGRYTIALMLPQQFTLMVSAYGALSAIVLGHFGDGVPRPPIFIMNDQSYAILAAVFHTLAMIGRAGGKKGD